MTCTQNSIVWRSQCSNSCYALRSTRAGIQHVNGSTAENIATAPAVIAATAATKDELSALGRASRSALAPLLEALFASKERHAILTFASDVYLCELASVSHGHVSLTYVSSVYLLDVVYRPRPFLLLL